ncbi:MAG: DUF3046 domain-containing protein [Corynebacterium sp.]|nr:DUF3046 domain-containing protein [Corynebacterium sp.]
MRLTEFEQLLADVFGEQQGRWIAHSHVISTMGDTANRLIERGERPRIVWERLCDDFDISDSERLGTDRPSM